MKIQTLKSVPIPILAQVFNQAFADYVVPFALSEESLEAKLAAENIRLDCSVGVFTGGQLTGFILVGIDTINKKLTAYNAGTGVIPECRGQQFTEKMYDFLLPFLRQHRIENHLLEVITYNEKAIAIYERIGFRKRRTLNCYKGNVALSQPNFDIRNLDPIDWKRMTSFWDFEPSYQNSVTAIHRMEKSLEFLGAFADGNLVGYIIFDQTRIKQFGVHREFRRKGIGRQLFDEVQKKAGNAIVSLINIDASNQTTNQFLSEIGLMQTVQQYEMGMEIS
jgi:ribosomal protein S18 acetylase RimI-like enzyme